MTGELSHGRIGMLLAIHTGHWVLLANVLLGYGQSNIYLPLQSYNERNRADYY